MKQVRFIAYVVIFLSLLCLWSAAVRHVSIGGKGLGPLTPYVEGFAEFPSLVKEVVQDADQGVYIPIGPDFKELNNLEREIWALGSYYHRGDEAWSIELRGLKSDSLVKNWVIRKSDIQGNRFLGYIGRSSFSNMIEFDHLRPYSAMLTDDGGVMVIMDGSNNALRFDKDNNLVWQNNEFVYHHSINSSHTGSIFLCGTKHSGSGHNSAFKNPKGSLVPFRDDMIVELDAETGESISIHSISEILISNGYRGLLGARIENDFDPIHLNDVQPVLTDGPYWKKGDLFLSLRNLNTVFLFRPSNDSILWLRTGPFLAQHDVDILTDSTISIFNNNYLIGTKREPIGPKTPLDIISSGTSSEYLTYDFSLDTFVVQYKTEFEVLNVLSTTEGLFQRLSDGTVFVENQNAGQVFLIEKDGNVILKKVFRVSGNQHLAHLPNWTRLYESIE